MDEKYNSSNHDFFGDVVVYKGNDLESRLLRIFTGDITHSAMRTKRNVAESLNLWGPVKHNLVHPKECYDEYIILRHKEITPEHRKNLRRLHLQTNSKYDLKLIFDIMVRKLQEYIPNKIDMSHEGKSDCSSRIAMMYHVLDLEINRDVHYSQIEPHHFLDSPYFEKIGEWKNGT